MDYPEYKEIIFTKGAGIGRITLNRPEHLNAFTRVMSSEIDDVFHRIKRDGDVKVVVIKGAGGAFTTGGDVGGVGEGDEERRGAAEPNPFVRVPSPRTGYATSDPVIWERNSVLTQLYRWYDLFWDLPQAVIAQVHGWCVITGLEFAMHCDLVIAAENARFHNRYIHGGGRLYTMWPLLIGMRMSKELLLTQRNFSGKEAAEWGMVNRAVPADRLEAEVNQLAADIAKQPLEIIALNKWSVNKFYEAMGLRQALEWSGDIHAHAHLSTPNLAMENLWHEKGYHEGVRTRDAQFPAAWEERRT
ncbi:MAG: enoyl-CoA hydratase/isomerase family protein [Chloroflexi bacterium]|nr:enoyl-CoA hydratase/isomerase family protein [Chloroflexota bacterium]